MPYWRLYYHVVWSTKDRTPSIDEEVSAIVMRSIKSSVNAMKSIPHAIGIVEDHVHVAISIPPNVLISDVIARMKGSSSHAVNEALRGRDFRWQPEYGILSFGEKALPDVVSYVKTQSARHASSRLWPGMERFSESPPTLFLNSSGSNSVGKTGSKPDPEVTDQ